MAIGENEDVNKTARLVEKGDELIKMEDKTEDDESGSFERPVGAENVESDYHHRVMGSETNQEENTVKGPSDEPSDQEKTRGPYRSSKRQKKIKI